MKYIHFESKDQQEADNKLNAVKPDVWKVYIEINPANFEKIYCIDMWKMERWNDGRLNLPK